MSPPLHPLLPYEVEQSIMAYSENDVRAFPLIKFNDSNELAAENAQHAPHYP